MSMLHKLGNKTLNRILKIFVISCMFIFCVSLLIILFWQFYTSVKSPIEYFENSFALPKKIRWQNFSEAMEFLNIELLSPTRGYIMYNFWDMLVVSVVWAFGVPFVSLFYTLMVSYVMSKYEWVGRNFLYALGIFVMLMPIYGSTGIGMVIRKAIGMYDNLWLTVLMSPGYCFSGMWFMLFYAGWKAIPMDYSEAAFIDGAGHARTMFMIMMPMMLPTFAAIFLMNFLSTWNDYGTFMLWLPSYANLSYGMYLFQEDAANYGAAIPQIMAGFIICMVPTTILFACSQKLIASKLTIGGLKG
ncbi:MAG: carbohydrate ABC transporter permease [Clostridiales bacterium]|nr:carbohydrate ABC transporter permease [Clostridiales bacterium]